MQVSFQQLSRYSEGARVKSGGAIAPLAPTVPTPMLVSGYWLSTWSDTPEEVGHVILVTPGAYLVGKHYV